MFRPGEGAFLALLGMLNDAGCVYLLMQHKRAVGRKTIGRVVVVRDDKDSGPHFVFEVRSEDGGAGNAGGSSCWDISSS